MTAEFGLAQSFKGRRVLVTGHTGFKGSWLVAWLLELGAEVSGFALAPEEGALFTRLGLASRIESRLGDIRDPGAIGSALRSARPEIVFHLAAQPLVRASYAQPRETFETNAMGVVNLLEAVRSLSGVRVCQVITTDKVYENSEDGGAYAEGGRLGGNDPYSASKACAELIAASYRASFLSKGGVSLSTARAGNVIGGGDWAPDRLIPDCVRALTERQPVSVRNGSSVRPWQHVLEPLSGYLLLAARQLERPAAYAEAWNFGPEESQHATVDDVVDAFLEHWGSGSRDAVPKADGAPKEAGVLRLDHSKARKILGWAPVYGLDRALRETAEWYKASLRPGFDALAATRAQITAYARAKEEARA